MRQKGCPCGLSLFLWLLRCQIRENWSQSGIHFSLELAFTHSELPFDTAMATMRREKNKMGERIVIVLRRVNSGLYTIKVYVTLIILYRTPHGTCPACLDS